MCSPRSSGCAPRLEAEFGDAQEFEFTVQEGQLFLLQTRTAKRTPWAALRIAIDQVHEGLISSGRRSRASTTLDLEAIRRRARRPEDDAEHSPGRPRRASASRPGRWRSTRAAERLARDGTPPVLVRAETVTDDIAASPWPPAC